MVNTEQVNTFCVKNVNYNILNIVVNTEQKAVQSQNLNHYNILNIVVNTEPLQII